MDDPFEGLDLNKQVVSYSRKLWQTHWTRDETGTVVATGMWLPKGNREFTGKEEYYFINLQEKNNEEQETTD